MVDMMHSKGFKYNTNVTDTVPYVFGQSSGVAIFSKIPLRSGYSEIFKNAGIFEFVNNKGFASAEIIVNEKKISLFNAHTDAHKESIRSLQLKQLISAIEKKKNSVIIVGGDLNINALHKYKQEYSELLKMMKSVGLKTIFPVPKKTEPSGCFDYLFVSSHVEIADKKVIDLLTPSGERVSDHFGLLGRKLRNIRKDLEIK
ncbi:Phospholipase C [Exaiptasia diaphana]|nr:Phospholipase C [Exaiptasia diaphana]